MADEVYIIRPSAGWEVVRVEDGEDKVVALAKTEKQARKYVRDFMDELKLRKAKKVVIPKAKK